MLDELTTEANGESFVIIHQHGGNDVTCKRSIINLDRDSHPPALHQIKDMPIKIEEIQRNIIVLISRHCRPRLLGARNGKKLSKLKSASFFSQYVAYM